MAPMLVIAIAVAGLIFGNDAAQGEIVGQIQGIVGVEGAMAVQGLLKSVSEPRDGIIAASLGIVTLVIGATAVFAELQSALDRTGTFRHRRVKAVSAESCCCCANVYCRSV